MAAEEMTPTKKKGANDKEDNSSRSGAKKNLSLEGRGRFLSLASLSAPKIVAAAMADARWNPGAVAKETVPMRKGDAGRKRNGASPGRGKGRRHPVAAITTTLKTMVRWLARRRPRAAQ